MADVTFQGLDELRRRISHLSNVRTYEDNALIKAGEHLREKLEERVYSYGLLKRSGKSERSFIVSKKLLERKVEVGVAEGGSNAFYLYFHENGTSKVSAKPFMRPTFEQEKTNLERIMANEIRRGLNL